MQRHWIYTWITAGTLLAAAAPSADLAQVHSVYLLPMGSGLDQYLANRLTNADVFSVVTNPKQADAVLTDQIGATFEAKLDELVDQGEPPEPAPDDDKTKAVVKKKDDPGWLRPSSFGRGKGNVFLVDVKTKRVIWSIYSRPKRYLPDDLDKLSARIVERLKKDRAGK